ncbi:L-rhamnose-binding lectin CSL3-like isoform X2 [Oculina patagonica]
MRSLLVVFVISLVVSGIHCGKKKRPAKTETSVTVCEGESEKISCQGNQKIQITAADYGRSAKDVCPAFLQDHNTNCHSPGALEITKNECEGHPECALYANNAEYGDPCFGTKKYLTVSYQCKPAKPNVMEKVRVCEDDQHSINCPGKRKIDIEYANYGRLTGGHVCGSFILTKDCKAAGSMSIVQDDCQGENTCVLEANNGKFGDPCLLTQKYLEVHYRCRK